jgi:hypothetical protein
MPLSTKCQLYHNSQFYCWRKLQKTAKKCYFHLVQIFILFLPIDHKHLNKNYTLHHRKLKVTAKKQTTKYFHKYFSWKIVIFYNSYTVFEENNRPAASTLQTLWLRVMSIKLKNFSSRQALFIKIDANPTTIWSSPWLLMIQHGDLQIYVEYLVMFIFVLDTTDFITLDIRDWFNVLPRPRYLP